MACAEAMAHGRPVVASAVGGLLDLVEDGVTGLLVPPGDVAALRSALERLLADPELRARWGPPGAGLSSSVRRCGSSDRRGLRRRGRLNPRRSPTPTTVT